MIKSPAVYLHFKDYSFLKILGTAIGTGLGNLGSGLISNCLGIGKRSAQDVSEGDVNTRLFGLCKPNCNTCSCFDNKCAQYCGSKCNNNGGGGILCKRSAQDVSEADVSGKLFQSQHFDNVLIM